MKPHVGLIGLGVMGSSLARNIESRGFPVAVFNRDQTTLKNFLSEFGSGQFVGAPNLPEFVKAMAAPRQIFLMIKAGDAVDQVAESLLPHLSKGDILIDAGNSYFKDTQRRERRYREAGIYFLGVGVSGGEEGALKGPSIMPGGAKEAWQIVAPLFDKIAAFADAPCTAYIGPDGAGHFVKTIHNGIEYGDMQLIAEAYHILRAGLEASPDALADVFDRWNSGPLQSFLIEITGSILKKRDDQGGKGFLVDQILDKAGQKGTGKWTAEAALELGVAIPTLAAAVDARVLSSLKEERVKNAQEFMAPSVQVVSGQARAFEDLVHDALYASKILAYAQGMALLAAASREYKWDLRLGEIAALWKGGCIIRARFLDQIRRAFSDRKDLPNLILDSGMKNDVVRAIPALRAVVTFAAQSGIPVPAFSASLSYFDSLRSAELPQNLTQAQRDFFGAHTYERKDRQGTFHTDW